MIDGLDLRACQAADRAAGPVVRIREAEGARTAADIRIADDVREAVDPDSLDGRREAVWRAWRATRGDNDESWVTEMYMDRVIVEEGDGLISVPYEISDTDRKVTFGEPTPVKVNVEYTPIEGEATEASPAGGPTRTTEVRSTGVGILEALDEEGWVWRVTLVRPGTSRNGRHYTPEVLGEAVQLYEGAKAFDGHRSDEQRRNSAVGTMVGWYENVTQAPDGSLQADFHIAESAPQFRQLFLSAWRNDRPDMIGFSHDVGAIQGTASIREGGRSVTPVKKIVRVHSVDIVADPSAGGRLERLVASTQGDHPMTLAEFLRQLRAGDLTEAQITEAYEAHPEWREVAEVITETSGGGDPTPAEPATTVTEAGSLSNLERRALIREAFDAAGLPEAAQESLRETLLEAEGLTAEDIERQVTETASIWAAALAANPSPLPGQGGRIETRENREDLQPALDGLLAGAAQENAEGERVRPFRTLKEAYSAYTGRHPYDGGDDDYNRWLLAESVGAVPYPDAQRVTESLTTASWAEALGDSITRRMIAEYNLPALSTWRQITSDVGPITDFRTNRRTRIGGYDVLPVVAEGGPYTALTSAEDEEATFAISKKGGTEDYTLEMVANDDVQALRRIPRKLGRAAALTLYRAVWVTTIEGNAVIYDGDTLFHEVNHGNLQAAPTVLDEDGIAELRQKMVTQTQPGEPSGWVGAMPRYLAVPPAHYVTAFKLTQSGVSVVGANESATTPNPWQGLVPIEVPVFANADDWYLIADPASIPTLEVGFYQGREEPELLVQDQPTVGTVFTHDKFTWKIRHIWGLTVLDYRGFQKGDAVA